MAFLDDQPDEQQKHVSKAIKCIDCGTHYLIPSDVNIPQFYLTLCVMLVRCYLHWMHATYQLDPKSDPNIIRILSISDTHNKHDEIESLPAADILVHAGDFTDVGSLKDIESYDQWIGDLVETQRKFKYAVLIAGSHSFSLSVELTVNILTW